MKIRKSIINSLVTAALSLTASSCYRSLSSDAIQGPSKSETDSGQMIIASFYGQGDGFSGKKTANGERFDPNLLTAAHRTLPYGTKLKLTNPENGKSVTVRINDRGPYVRNRDLDISYQAAQNLGVVEKGVFKLKLVETSVN